MRSGKPARQPQWLLFKDKDGYAGTLEADDLLADVAEAPTQDQERAGAGKAGKKGLAAVPTRKRRRKQWASKALALAGACKAPAHAGWFEPQLARLGAAPPQGEQWVHELKWDGYRILATVREAPGPPGLCPLRCAPCRWSRRIGGCPRRPQAAAPATRRRCISGFGSLLLAQPDSEHGWRYAGRVGTGFTDALIGELAPCLARGGRKAPTVHVGETDTDLRTATWFEPRFVVEAFYRGIGRQGLLRQASLKAVRPDKDVRDLADSDRGVKAREPARAMRGSQGNVASTAKARMKGAKAVKQIVRSELPVLSSPDKVLFPDIGATKQDAWDYYAAVMEHLLPGIVGRPLSIVRCPNGIGESCFFQKHHTAGLERVGSVRLKEESGQFDDYLVVNDAAGLMELVQFNALEFHPWGSHAEEPDLADRVVFDLDPGPGVPFDELKAAARDIRKRLDALELESFLKVTGGKGLHVVVPLNPGCEWGLVRDFARGFADALAGSEPQRFVAVAARSRRKGKIFIDYLRNGRGATAVACYSLRARPGAPVAMPLAWDQLSRLARPDVFTIRDVPRKLKRRRKDPWEGIARVEQDLARWARDA